MWLRGFKRCLQPWSKYVRSSSVRAVGGSSSSSESMAPCARIVGLTAGGLGVLAYSEYSTSTPSSHTHLEQAASNEYHVERDATFLNWSNTHQCKPRQVFYPEAKEQVAAIVKEHQDTQSKLRVMGSGVSPNGLGFGTSSQSGRSQDILTTAHMDRLLHVDEKTNQVTVESGMVVGDLLQELKKYHLTMENVASIREQQIGGVTQAGCHGTGAKIPPLEEQIVEIEMYTPGKGWMVLSNETDPKLFSLVKCGLGAFGVITKVKLQCVPMHKLVEETQVMTIQQVKQQHEKLLSSYQHLRYMWIPYTDYVVVVMSNPIDEKIAELPETKDKYPPSFFSRDMQLRTPRNLYLSLVDKPDPEYENWSFTKLRDKLIELNPLDKEHIIRVNQAEKEYWEYCEGFRIAYSDEIIGFDCGGQQLVQEVAFPVKGANDLEFVENLLKKIDEADIPAPAPIEQRWCARSTSAMSPAHSEDPNEIFSWVGVILYLPTLDPVIREDITNKFNEYYRLLRDYMKPFKAIEHWAKVEVPSTKEEKEELRKRQQAHYPLKEFKKARDELDPHHILSNELIDEMLA